MVTLLLSSFDHLRGRKEFSIIGSDLESALDLANLLISNQSDFQKVQLVDNGKKMQLPLALFDGQPFKEPLDGLKKEWQYLLNQPSLNELAEERRLILIDLLKKRVDECNEQMALIELAVVRLEMKTTELEMHSGQKTIFSALFDRYSQLIKRYRELLSRVHERKYELTDQLNKL